MVGIHLPAPVVGCPVVQIIYEQQQARSPTGMTSLEVVSAGLCGLGTLLGPEATGLLLPPWWGWVCCRSILVVGCGVCFVDSGCEHLTSKAPLWVLFVLQFLFLGFCVCKCLRAHGGCLGIESR